MKRAYQSPALFERRDLPTVLSEICLLPALLNALRDLGYRGLVTLRGKRQ